MIKEVKLMKKPTSNSKALRDLADAEGYVDVINMLNDLMTDQPFLCNTVCMNCGAQDKMEPDQGAGYCSECGMNEVKHAFVLAEVI